MVSELQPTAVVFDFNGTLSDDEHLLLDIFRAMFHARLGWRMTEDDYRRDFAGLSDREIVEQALAYSGREHDVEALLVERSERYRAAVAERNPVREEARALVSALVATDRRLAIVTGAQRAEVETVLAGVPEATHFEVVVTDEDVERGKPDPEGVLRAADLLGLAPAQLLVLEDTVPGVRAALAAGAAVIAVAGTQPPDRLRAEGVEVVSRIGPELLDRPPFAG